MAMLAMDVPPPLAPAPPARVLTFADEFRFTTSRDAVPAGVLILQVKNIGEDEHDFRIRGPKGVAARRDGHRPPRRARPDPDPAGPGPLHLPLHRRRPRRARHGGHARGAGRQEAQAAPLSAAQHRAARVERLLWRAGFGPRPGEVDAAGPQGRARAPSRSCSRPAGAPCSGPAARVDGAPLDPVNAYGHEVLWWLDRAVRTEHPLVERMTFNWHDHFATSNDDVGNSRLMIAQYWTLRRGALGKFRTLARAITRDGAMQLFLSLANSEKESPNENFARELLELFTLGVNNGYTEKDVREAARALTGFTYDYDTKKFGFDPDRHDPGVKRIMGRVGRFKPLDVVDLAVGHKAHAPFSAGSSGATSARGPARRLCCARWRGPTVRADTDVRPVLREILTHKLFYAGLAEPDMIKPPFVYAAGHAPRDRRAGRRRELALPPRPDGPGAVPPAERERVGGRHRVAVDQRPSGRASTRPPPCSRKTIKDGSISAKQTPAQAIASAVAATGHPRVGPRTAKALQRYAGQVGGGAHRRLGGQALLPRAPARAAPPAAGRPRRPGLLRRPR